MEKYKMMLTAFEHYKKTVDLSAEEQENLDELIAMVEAWIDWNVKNRNAAQQLT